MQQWDRDTSGRLNRISTQLDPASEASVPTDTMDPLPEEQQSQPATPMNPNAYRTMRDHIHPLRVSAPSCIIPPADDVAVRPYLVPLLPTYHGMESENPYTHLRDFEEVCTTFKEGMMDMDLLKLKAFPLTLKDKAKIWLNSLRPRTIRNWAELQAEFLKKFFNAHKTNNLKRQIYTFAAQDGEKFYQCWERFLETISACPHHGFDTWMLVNHFYGGMSPAMRQLLETMCGGDFLSNHPDEAMDFLNYVAETSKGWDEPNPRELERFRPPVNQRGGMYALNDEMEMKARLSTLARKVEELEGKQLHEVQAVTDNTAQTNPCTNFQSPAHPTEQCSMTPAVKDLMSECAHTVGQFKPQQSNAPYGNTFNPNWIPVGCPIFDQFHFGTHLIPCPRSSQLSQFLDWPGQSLPFAPLPLCHFDNPPLVDIAADHLGLQWSLVGCPTYAQNQCSAHLIFGPGNSPQYGFFHSIGH